MDAKIRVLVGKPAWTATIEAEALRGMRAGAGAEDAGPRTRGRLPAPARPFDASRSAPAA